MTNENCKIIYIKWKMLIYGFSRNNVCVQIKLSTKNENAIKQKL